MYKGRKTKRKMIFTKIIYLLLAFDTNGNKTHYYKLITHNKKNGCVEAYTTNRMAKTFNAQLGTCYGQNCTTFKGTYKMPFCCDVNGYICENDDNL